MGLEAEIIPFGMPANLKVVMLDSLTLFIFFNSENSADTQILLQYRRISVKYTSPLFSIHTAAAGRN